MDKTELDIVKWNNFIDRIYRIQVTDNDLRIIEIILQQDYATDKFLRLGKFANICTSFLASVHTVDDLGEQHRRLNGICCQSWINLGYDCSEFNYILTSLL